MMKRSQTPSTAVVPAGRVCPRCGAPLGGFGPEGLCGACLFDSGLAADEPVVELDLLASGPRRFGDYELLEEIARGGMGVIFKARHLSLNRVVAVKMILRGDFASVADLARFRAEAETAARLQHPNIVAVHEVGEQEGQPYFSMDYVEGQNLAQLVGNTPLPTAHAATYLKTIAEAVQYAHQKGILHRDLKPSNVLIDTNDQPRVTDFGLARHFNNSQPSTNDSHLTQTGQVLGSPSFMPPEQTAAKSDSIGPASDVYSLGAMLYHMITGRPPFVAESVPATLRMVAETEPVSPRLLNASVPRDLETICLKCLEKSPLRRYASAQELANELDRFLRDQPIHARPVSQAERVLRWCRRKPALATAIALVLVVAIGSPIAAYRINRERLQTQASQRMARVMTKFLADMLEGAGPSAAQGRDATMLKEILDRTAQSVGKDLKDQPEAEADVRLVLGKTYADLGFTTNALAMTQEALRLRQSHLGPMNPATADAFNNLGAMLYDTENYAGAEDAARHALAIRTNLFGQIDTNVALSLNNLGLALWNQNKLVEAEDAEQRSLAIRKKLLPADHPDIGVSLINLAGVQWARTRFTEVEANFGEALRLFGKVGNPVIVGVLQANLATMFARRGDLAAAQELHERTLALRRNLYKGDHPNVEISLTQLGLVLAARDDLTAAESRFQEALAMQERMNLGKHTDVADALAGLGIILTKKGDWAAAEEKNQQALAMRIEVLKGEENPDVVDSLDALAVIAIARGDFNQAERMLVRAITAAQKSHSPDYPAVIPALWRLGWILLQKDDQAGYAANNREALAISRKHGVYGAWPLLKGIYDLADVLKTQGKFSDAEPLLAEAATYVQKNLGDNAMLQRDAYQRLVRFYEAWDRSAPNSGKADQVAEWRKKLEALNQR